MVQNLNFEPVTDRLPPQNIEAEEAILGGILLDPEAIGRVMEILVSDAFYIGAHKSIYKAALALHGRGQPTDLMTVTAWLRDNDLLDKIGGQSRLAQLVDRTISAANIDQYAALVMDKYTRRKLIQVSGEIAQMGYDTTTPLESVLDQAEQKLFNITQDRPQSGLTATSDILIDTFSEIEQRSLGVVLPGVPCSFYDLDAMTQGFQRSDLIIAAGRPSMGKCLSQDAEIVLADGSVKTIEEIYDAQSATLLTLESNWRFKLIEPSAYIDDGLKPVFRVTTRSGRTIETTLTHPYLTPQGWQPLGELKVGQKIAVPRTIPVFGQETWPDYQVKLLAYLIGDGYLTGTRANPRLQNDFKAAALKFPDIKLREDTPQGQRTPALYITSDGDEVKQARHDFGQQLTALLQETGQSARWLAQTLEVSPRLLTLWQQGRCAPDAITFDILCHLLQTSPDQLAPGGIATIQWLSQSPLTLWLQEQGVWSQSADQSTIPEGIFRLTKPQLALFLNRLFATDGWARVLSSEQCQLGFATVSEKLARQIQHLLLRFGVVAQLKTRSVTHQGSRRPAWQLEITDVSSIQAFIQDIGIFGQEAALAKVETALASRRSPTNRDLVPIAIGDQIASAQATATGKSLTAQAGIQGSSHIHAAKQALSRQQPCALTTAIEHRERQAMTPHDVYWDEIVEIEPQGMKPVYDLTIPETHNFVANDICVHNTSFVLNIARNISAINKLPVAIFSLEMSKLQLVYRLLSSEVEIESSRLRSGRIAQPEWEKLGHAISVLSQMPIFIDDTPNISVTEMRSKARRLQAEQGGALGLILLDYLQLMEGGGDNRVQELSKITRSLKGLARELNTPIIALSQLSRGVESRTNKRPMMSDLRECVTGDTLVWLADGRRLPIAELVGQAPDVISMDQQGYLLPARADCIWEVGSKSIFELTTVSGRKLKATAKHRLYTLDGWQRLQDLRVGNRLAVASRMPLMERPPEPWPDLQVILLAHLIGNGSYLTHQPLHYTTASEANSAVVTAAAESFGCTVNRHAGDDNRHQLVISGNGNRWHLAEIGLWLKELGIFNQHSADKCVPPEIFQRPADQVALFLQHLWATDGGMISYQPSNGKPYKASIGFSTVSETLARDVVALLARLSIVSTMQWTKSRGYTVQLDGKTQQLKFLESVAAFGPRLEAAEAVKAALLHPGQHRGKSNSTPPTMAVEVFDGVKADIKTQGVSQPPVAALQGSADAGTHRLKCPPTGHVSLHYAEILDSTELKDTDLKDIATSDLHWDEIAEIKPLGDATVYDLTVPGPASWLADGIVSHNSGAIEQDADLIMMLYREEYYEPDTPDRGITEVIITKHRNGPTGTVKLLFEPQFTRFRNLARPG